MRSIRKKLMQSNWVIPLAGALILTTAHAFAQSLPPINLLHENPKCPLTWEEREYQKQLDDAYKSTINKMPEQRANDPWAAVRRPCPPKRSRNKRALGPLRRRPKSQLFDDFRHNAVPVRGRGLPEQSCAGIPRTIITIEQPTPIGNILQKDPYRPPQRAGQMDRCGVGRDHQVKQ